MKVSGASCYTDWMLFSWETVGNPLDSCSRNLKRPTVLARSCPGVRPSLGHSQNTTCTTDWLDITWLTQELFREVHLSIFVLAHLLDVHGFNFSRLVDIAPGSLGGLGMVHKDGSLRDDWILTMLIHVAFPFGHPNLRTCFESISPNFRNSELPRALTISEL